jgi:hypothetical protein
MNCNTCGGLTSGTVVSNCLNSQPIILCSCNYGVSCSNERQGWICSRCNKSLSPDIKECDCAPNGTFVPWTPYPYNPYVPVYPSPYVPYNPYTPYTPFWDTTPVYHGQLQVTCYNYSRNP